MIKKVVFAIVLMLISGYLFHNYLIELKQKDTNNLLQTKLDELHIAQKAILNTYAVITRKLYQDIIYKSDIVELLAQMKSAPSSKKTQLQKQLLKKLQNEYDVLQTLYINQLYIYTYDGENILQFYAASKEHIEDIDSSIENMLLQQRKVVGFEIVNGELGFHYFYPIFSRGVYLGSMEFFIRFDLLKSKLQEVVHYAQTQLLIADNIINEDLKKQFIPVASDYLVKKKQFQFSILKDLLQSQKAKLEQKLAKHQDFFLSSSYMDNGYGIFFLALKDITHKHIGYVCIVENITQLQIIEQRFKTFHLLAFLFFSFVTFLIITIILQVEKITQESHTLQRVIDIDESIVVLTDGKRFEFANKSFLKFFGYDSLEDFLKEHDCICEYFLPKEGFFSLKNLKKGQNWIEALLKLSPRKRIVSMKNTQGIVHAFSVSIGQYDQKKYVISFSDITDTMREKLYFEQLMVTDQLTHAYNRIFFEQNIESILHKHKVSGKKTGIIFFDIDHFKQINDTYGHDVGDSVLKTLVEIVQKNIRFEDKLIRWGGEEFIIIVAIESPKQLEIIAQALRKKIASHHFENVEHITCSFGLAIKQKEESIEETIKRADENLYHAKNSGRDQVVWDGR